MWRIRHSSTREVFEIVRRPHGAQTLRYRYIHHVKRLLDSVRFKSRLVVLGCGQRYGIDYNENNETFAPVAKADSINSLCVVLCIQSTYPSDGCRHSFSLLYAPLEEDIYIYGPPAAIVGISRDHCLKLKKSLY